MVWLNIDFPLKSCTLHREDCSFRSKKESKYKGLGRLKGDGGWLPFPTNAKAESYYLANWHGKGYGLIHCSRCNP